MSEREREREGDRDEFWSHSKVIQTGGYLSLSLFLFQVNATVQVHWSLVPVCVCAPVRPPARPAMLIIT